MFTTFRSLMVVALALSVAVLSGCAGITAANQGPAAGFLYTKTQGPLTATSVDSYNKTGMAKAKSILGLVGTGDASIDAAAEEGNIDQIQSVDRKFKNILGVYAETTTIVRGK